MFFLEVLEWVLVIGAAAIVLFQIVIPSVKGTPVFPIFRRGMKKALESKLARAKGEVEEAELAHEIEELQEMAKSQKGEGI